MMVFPRALFLATTFPNFQNFLKISQQLGFFVQTREKLTQDFWNFVENMVKQCIFCYFLKKSLKIFSTNSQTIVFFVETRENLTQDF